MTARTMSIQRLFSGIPLVLLRRFETLGNARPSNCGMMKISLLFVRCIRIIRVFRGQASTLHVLLI